MMVEADTPGTLRVKVIAGPAAAFGPLRVDERLFDDPWGSPRSQHLKVGWLPRVGDRQTHDDLAWDVGDNRIAVAARSLGEDFGPGCSAVLVLPRLAREALGSEVESGDRLSVVSLLKRLFGELSRVELEVLVVSVAGLETFADHQSEISEAAATVLSHLTDAGIERVVSKVEILDAEHPAYWRIARNLVFSNAGLAERNARHLVESLSSDARELAAQNADGRSLLALAGCLSSEATSRRETAGASSSEAGDPERRRIRSNGKSVTLVCEKLAARSGGAERVLIELANDLNDRGYQVDIVSHELRGVPPFYEISPGVVHTNLSPLRGAFTRRDKLLQMARAGLERRVARFPLDRLVWKLRYMAFANRLGKHIDATRPDVVVPFMPPAIIASALAQSEWRPRFLASMHNAPEQDFENPDRWDPSPYARRRRLEIMDQMDSIGVLLPDYQDWYPDHLRSRTTVIPNAIKPVSREFLSGAPRQKIVVSVGRLAHVKRHDLTLRAFAQLSDEHPDWELRIFGVGPLEVELKALRDELGLEGKAHILGHTSKIGDEYLNARILSHPAKFEGFPLAVCEALASGVPVVGFDDCSGLNSLVVDGVNGYLVDPGDRSDESRLAGLVSGLNRLMTDEATRASLSDKGPASMAPFAPELVVDIWEAALFSESSSAS